MIRSYAQKQKNLKKNFLEEISVDKAKLMSDFLLTAVNQIFKPKCNQLKKNKKKNF